jgi:O-antigen ligase
MNSTYLSRERYLPARTAARNFGSAAQNVFASASREFWVVVGLTALHAPVGLLFYNFKSAAVLHAYLTLALGLYFVFENKPNSLIKIAYLTAYLTGVEVLWRMADAPIFWEYGKYAISLVLFAAIARSGAKKIAVLPLIYFALLIPACFVTLFGNDLNTARGKISSNISGPLVIAACCCFFSVIQLNWRQVRRLFIALIIPISTVAFTALFYTVSNPEISFNTESNHATSGGFGPNQVSSILGLGSFVALMLLILMNNQYKFKILFAVLALFLAAQSVLTFSRGGMYNVIGAVAIVILVQARDIKKTVSILIPVLLITVLFIAFIFPLLNDFTGGLLQERFESTDPANRVEIIESDFQILFENPVLGIGIGEAKIYRQQIFSYVMNSHTEFTRLISEHGLFGIAAIVMLVVMSLFGFQKQKTPFGKAIVAGAVVWSCLYMLNSGMRLSAPGFFWGLAYISLIPLKSAFRKNQNSE